MTDFGLESELKTGKIECFLLTWHGTVLCAQPSGAGLCHKPLQEGLRTRIGCRISIETALPEKFASLLPIADEKLIYDSELLGAGVATKASGGRGYNFAKAGKFLCAQGSDQRVDWDRGTADVWESFLPIPVELIRQISALSSHSWMELSSGERIAGKSISFKSGFVFSVGHLQFDIIRTYPTLLSRRGSAAKGNVQEFVFAQRGKAVAFSPVPDRTDSGSEPLSLRKAEDDPIEQLPYPYEEKGSDGADLSVLKSADCLYYPPAFAHREDREFFTGKASHKRPALGFVTNEVRLRRRDNLLLMLHRGLEGTLFNHIGVHKGHGFLLQSDPLPDGLTRRGDRFFIDRALIDDTPHLSGHYQVFYNGNLQNYYHWLIEGVLSLYVLNKIAQDDVKVVLPSMLGDVSNIPYIESLKLLCFDNIDFTFTRAPIVRLERASWIAAHEFVEDLPPRLLREFQTMAMASIGSVLKPTRIYVEREHLRRVENAAEVRDFLERAGFITVQLEGMSILEQMKLFASAEFVVATHGAGLSNLIFSPPSTRVIEFMPASEMRAFFWQISSKLGHEYGMIRCETDNGSFNGRLRVDLQKFIRLFSLLEKA